MSPDTNREDLLEIAKSIEKRRDRRIWMASLVGSLLTALLVLVFGAFGIWRLETLVDDINENTEVVRVEGQQRDRQIQLILDGLHNLVISQEVGTQRIISDLRLDIERQERNTQEQLRDIVQAINRILGAAGSG